MNAIEGATAGNLPVPKAGRTADIVKINFGCRQGLYSRIWRDGLLNAITLRLYRFWANTEFRQRLWACIAIDQDPLEFRGTVQELLRSFLIALVVIAPLYLVLTALRAMLQGNAIALALLAWSCVVGLIVVGAAGSYLARRYILSRTLWRGIHAGQDGSCFQYAVRAVFWSIFVLVSLGGALPWMLTDLARYRLNHTMWGHYRGSFNGDATALLSAWLPLWLAIVAPGLGYGLWIVSDEDWNVAAVLWRFSEAYQDLVLRNEGAEFLLWAAVILAGLNSYFLFVLRHDAWYLGGLQLGPMRLKSSSRFLDGLRAIGPGLFYLNAICLAVVAASYIVGTSDLLADEGYRIPTWYLLLFLFFLAPLAKATILRHVHLPRLGWLLAGAELSGIAAADSAQQQIPYQSGGEGLWDIAGVKLV